jgi:hypothetical protein
MGGFGMWAAALAVPGFVASPSWKTGVFLLVFGGGFAFFVSMMALLLQRMFFGVAAEIDPRQRRFSARYGLFRVRRTLDATHFLSLRPLATRAGWGHALCLRREGRRRGWFLCMDTGRGSKLAARLAAERLARQIRERWPAAPLRFEKWDWPGEAAAGAGGWTKCTVSVDAGKLLARRGWPRGTRAKEAFVPLAITLLLVAGFGFVITHEFAELGPDPSWTALAGRGLFALLSAAFLLPALFFVQAEALPSFALVHAEGGWFAKNFGIFPLLLPLRRGFSFRLEAKRREDGWWTCRVSLKRAGGRIWWLVHESERAKTKGAAEQTARGLAARLALLPGVAQVETDGGRA